MYILGPIMFVVSTTFFFIPFPLRFYAKTKNYIVLCFSMSGTINIKVFCKDIPNHICYRLTRQFLKHYPIRSFDDPCQPCLIVNWYQVPTLGRDLGRNISVKFGSIPLIHLENKIEKFYVPSNCNNFRAKTHALLCASSRI